MSVQTFNDKINCYGFMRDAGIACISQFCPYGAVCLDVLFNGNIVCEPLAFSFLFEEVMLRCFIGLVNGADLLHDIQWCGVDIKIDARMYCFFQTIDNCHD